MAKDKSKSESGITKGKRLVKHMMKYSKEVKVLDNLLLEADKDISIVQDELQELQVQRRLIKGLLNDIEGRAKLRQSDSQQSLKGEV